jgi:hypothetical protein
MRSGGNIRFVPTVLYSQGFFFIQKKKKKVMCAFTANGNVYDTLLLTIVYTQYLLVKLPFLLLKKEKNKLID